MKLVWRWVLMAVMGLSSACGWAQANQHTDPLNLDPLVRQGYDKFYNLDFDSAVAIFNKVAQAHPN
ncbi:MAG: hypothetical protein ABI142_14075, partial [Bryocella sp.]